MFIKVVEGELFGPYREDVVTVVEILPLVKVLGNMEGSISDTGTFKPRSRAIRPSVVSDGVLTIEATFVIKLDSDLVD